MEERRRVKLAVCCTKNVSWQLMGKIKQFQTNRTQRRRYDSLKDGQPWSKCQRLKAVIHCSLLPNSPFSYLIGEGVLTTRLEWSVLLLFQKPRRCMGEGQDNIDRQPGLDKKRRKETRQRFTTLLELLRHFQYIIYHKMAANASVML